MVPNLLISIKIEGVGGHLCDSWSLVHGHKMMAAQQPHKGKEGAAAERKKKNVCSPFLHRFSVYEERKS